jgi:dihydroxy-acid dehydratase
LASHPAEGGPIALVRSGERITIDAEKNEITADVPEAEMKRRRAEWTMPPYKATRGTLAKYIRLVKNASEGCVTDE